MLEYLMDKFYETKCSADVDILEGLIADGATEDQLIEYLQNNL